MHRFLVVALFGLSLLAISTAGFAQSGSVTIQVGDPSDPHHLHPNRLTNTMEAHRPMLQHTGIAPSTSTVTILTKCLLRACPGLYFYMAGHGWAFAHHFRHRSRLIA